MNGMLWKEVRENGKWAALCLLGIGGGMAYGLSQVSPGRPTGLGKASLTAPAFMPVTVLGMAAAGGLLGLLQTLPERRPDAWAFLVHRPVTRSRLFLSKVSAGLLLYLLAAGLPLLGACLWAAAPGHIPAPFDWRLALPGLADLLAGMGYYFAGMLVGLRQARWYGSRVLVVGAAVIGSLVVVSVPEFWQALLAALLTVAVTATAAWGAFLSGGADGGGAVVRMPRLARAALGVTLFFGIVLLGEILFEFMAVLFFGTSYSRYRSTNYYVLRDGQVARVTLEGQDVAAITDLGGKPIEKYRDVTDTVALGRIIGNSAQASLVFDATGEQLGYWGRDTYRNSVRYFVSVDDRGASYGRSAWYYMRAKSELVGYETEPVARIGAIGPDGFVADDRDAPRRFAGSLRIDPNWTGLQMPLLTFSSAVYRPRLEQQRVQLLFAAPAGETILGAGQSGDRTSWGDAPASGPNFLAAATDKAIYLLPTDEPGSPDARRAPTTTPLSHDWRRYDRVSIVTATGDGDAPAYLVRYSPSWRLGLEAQNLPDFVDRVSADGKIESEISLPPLRQEAPRSPEVPMVLGGTVVPPLALLAVGLSTLTSNPTTPLHEALLDPDVVTVGIPCIVSAFACCAMALTLARRYAFTPASRAGWAIGSLLLGPAAVFTLLAIRQWPARECCPSCGRKRVVTREHCEHCGTAFAPPPADGTEIFEG